MAYGIEAFEFGPLYLLVERRIAVLLFVGCRMSHPHPIIFLLPPVEPMGTNISRVRTTNPFLMSAACELAVVGCKVAVGMEVEVEASKRCLLGCDACRALRTT